MTTMIRKPKEIADEIADAGALIQCAERQAVVSAAAAAIRAARKGAVYLTPAELTAALEAIGQMTSGNAHDFDSWKEQTHGTRRQWQALLNAEEKLIAAKKGARA